MEAEEYRQPSVHSVAEATLAAGQGNVRPGILNEIPGLPFFASFAPGEIISDTQRELTGELKCSKTTDW
jgi:hypothetical protein